MVIADSVDAFAHVIQVALTPVFLFSGIATLLGVLSTRLARVADRVDDLAEKLALADARERRRMARRLAYLKRRSKLLDAAVILATLAGMSTLFAAGLLFVGGLRERAGASLFVAFGVALALGVGALGAFLVEMLLASVGLREEAETVGDAASAQAPR